jgi:3-hydroxyisobutyrate dehydrogenase-like beta-hydroxyacid dehydrogenase
MADSNRVAAVIGLGNLGAPIAERLLERGWDVQVSDPVESRRDALIEKGATSPVDAGRARFICFVTPDETAIHGALDDGLASELTSDHVVVVHSTILPESARRLAERVADTGAGFVEAPVTGGAERARTGELTVFAGGTDADLERAAELFRDLGTQILAMGPAGAASATKLANQLVLFASTAAIHEALGLTAHYGVEDAAVLHALESGLGDSWSGRHWGFFDKLAADYDEADVPRDVRPWAKDLREAVEAAREAGAPAPVAAVLADVVPGLIENHARAARQEEEQE